MGLHGKHSAVSASTVTECHYLLAICQIHRVLRSARAQRVPALQGRVPARDLRLSKFRGSVRAVLTSGWVCQAPAVGWEPIGGSGPSGASAGSLPVVSGSCAERGPLSFTWTAKPDPHAALVRRSGTRRQTRTPVQALSTVPLPTATADWQAAHTIDV
jgi:hypothetical protein